jgi:hypothetical protein
MENQNETKQEIITYLKNIYNSYDNTSTGTLSGTQQANFNKAYAVVDSESDTFDNFCKKYFNEFDYTLDIVNKFFQMKNLVLTKKSINLKVNNDDTISPKITASLNLIFNPEHKKTLIKDIYSQYELNSDKTFVMMKFYCDAPNACKEKLEKIMQIIYILIVTKAKKGGLTDFLEHEIFYSRRSHYVKDKCNTFLFNYDNRNLKYYNE